MTSTEFRSVVDRYLTAGPAAATEPPPAPTSALDIAVVGMAGRFPGADDVRTFWENLAAGRKSVGELPTEILGEGARGYRWGGVIADRDCFDPEFFGIDPREADSMNLHQRLLLQEAWHAVEDAGIDPFSLYGSDTGMFVGAEPAGYLHESFTGASDALVAARLSYFLDWHGPALVVNTACSSSVVAIHMACRSLLAGDCGMALAGGANVGLDQSSLNLLADMGVLSPSGECRTFDNSANGTVFAEGVAVLVLKRLADAEAAGDDIRGVIRATGVNHDGASNGLTAPNGPAQEKLVETVYRRHGIDTSRVGYVEAHGTGTVLGDPVEAGALARAFSRQQPNPDGCVLGSAKANVGHTGAAAGAIGLVKVLLSMRNERFPGMPTFRTLNPMIKLDGSGITIDAVGRPWPATPGAPRLAAVNSMGHSGTNAHLVVEEYQPAPRPAAGDRAPGPVAVPLSARDGERLGALAGELADHLERVCATGAESGQDTLRRLIADLLGIDPGGLRGDRNLESHGAEPHQLAQLANLLARQTGRQVTVDTLYESPSVDSLVASLAPAARPDERQPVWAPPTLADVAVTLQQGRAALDERAVVVAGSVSELVAALRALAAGRPTADTTMGRARTGAPRAADGTPAELAAAWCRGAEVSWPATDGRRISLPGYPFARNRHGRDRLAPRPAAGAAAAPAARPQPAGQPGPAPRPAAEPRIAPAAPAAPAPAAPAPAATVAPAAAPVAPAEPSAPTAPAPATVPAAPARPAAPAAAPAAPAVAAYAPADTGPQAAAGPGGLREDVALWLTRVIADEVGVDPAAVDRWERFDAFGVDSVVRTRVNQYLAQRFPAASRTLLFEFPTIDEVADLLTTDFPADCRTALQGAEPVPGVQLSGGGGAVGVEPAVVPSGAAVGVPASGGGDVVGWLSGVVGEEAGVAAGEVDPWRSWDAFGIDSVVRTRVNHRIAEVFPDASRTLLFEFGCVAEVAESLAADFPADSSALPGAPAGVAPAATGASAPSAEPIPEWPAEPTWAAPFPAREIGFSASRVLLHPEADPDDTQLVREHQAELLDVLLRGEDLDRADGLFDLHGAQGAAGLRLAARHRTLRVHIRTADPAQAEAAARAAKEHGLDTRVTVAHTDPATVHEVALGLEGSHLVADKAAHLAGIAAALPEGGRLLLADFLAVGSERTDPGLGIRLPTPEQWADHLADAGFVLDDAVDASARVGHFLADFDVDQHTAGLDPRSKDRWRFHTDLAVPLERGTAAYLLLRLRKDTTAGPAAGRAANRARIAAATPYAEAVTR
ncbi:beta-ketoacyl synthase N-terminal-like domain-containing protein [Streptomyces qinglanensis]|uniref:Phosphopantetheine attachment site n=1 Tax=Streptomyces qinglanensis TaxID=943816 RepID=A0A1H9V1T1_9ACTN|nr:beta-ketoacyl synthase N-terminal-like domain-containing protein [Streptomyces qinglanensis]SES15632.1 Phosphopantetheine attachment site [Streptomyces qinglanensis]